MFDNVPAPLLYASATQINAIVPYEVAGRVQTNVTVLYLGNASNALTLGVVAANPGIFSLTETGNGPGAILNQDYSVNSASNPAAKGSFVSIYMTGEGVTSPPQATGSVTPTALPLPLPKLPVVIDVGGIPLQAQSVYYAGEAPGLVAGVMQLTVVVPPGIGSGPQALAVTVGTASNKQQTIIVNVQ
jgi:uncharacterized protein (TIGR03437 family)